MTEDNTVVNMFPKDMREDVAAITVKFTAPATVYCILFSQELLVEARGDLTEALAGMSVAALDDNWDATPETLWFENIMYFMKDHIKPDDGQLSGIDTYKPDMIRPPGVDAVIRKAKLTGYQWWPDGSVTVSGRPGKELIDAAAQSTGGWVVEVDGDPGEGAVHPHRVRGMWQVGGDGVLTGLFNPNPDYRPQP